MTRAIFPVALVTFAALAPAQAEPVYLSGTIGKAPVLVMVERKAGEISGWYLYLRYGREIRLDGTVDAAGHFTITETTPGASQATGILKGAIHGATWTGAWNPPAGGAPVALALSENRDTIFALSGRFSCRAKPPGVVTDYSFDQSLDLVLAGGRATKLSVSHRAIGKNDEQVCSINLGDLERVSSPTGILYRAKGDEPGVKGGHCSVRVVAAGDYLYLQMGDFTEEGNDCRGSSEQMFCSARGNFNDLILNRKTGACTMVE